MTIIKIDPNDINVGPEEVIEYDTEKKTLTCCYEIFSECLNDIDEEIVDQRRWMTTYRYVKSIRINGIDRYFELNVDHPSTESSGDNEYDMDDTIVASEVFKKEVVTTVYV